MEKIQLGKSDLYVTPIAFGAWAIGGWMWGGADKNDALDALDAALANGMTTIDTAPAYGFGRSEEIVGEALKGKRNEAQILTKFGLRWDTREGEYFFDTFQNDGRPVKMHKYSGKESVINECEQSLRRLGTDYIDLLQIHWPDATTPIPETMEALEMLMQQGKVRAAGVCNYNADQLEEAAKYLSIASDQMAYSMVNRGIEKNLVPQCLKNDISILAYSPLQRGLLTGKISVDHKFGEGDSRSNLPHFAPENIKAVNTFLDQLRPLAEEKKSGLSQLVTAWTIAQPGISVALVGARNRMQVEENVLGVECKLSIEDINMINKALDKLSLSL